MNTKIPLLILYFTNKEIGYDECAPKYLKLCEKLKAPPDTLELTIFPWLKSIFNTIGAVYAQARPIPQTKPPNEDAARSEAVNWFISAKKTMQNGNRRV